jgi:hypothetical protein
MGALLESGLVGNIGLKHLKVIKEDTINKWDKLGFLEGLKGHMRENVAQLYENQASFLINEASSTSDTGAFETVVFPIVRRVFSKLLANDIVSVQAMNLPIGKLFYFVPNIQQYEVGGEQSDNTGIHYPPYGAPNADPAQTPNSGYDYNVGRDLYDRFYEGNEPALDPPGLYDYSKGQFSAITGTAVTAQWNSATLNLDPAAYALTDYRKVLVIMSGFASDAAGKLIGPDGQPMDNESFLADLTLYGIGTNTTTSGTTRGGGAGPYLFRVVTQRYGKGIVQYGNNNSTLAFPESKTGGGQYDNICDAQGYIYLEVDLQVPVCITCGGSMDGYTGSTFSSSTANNNAFVPVYRIYKNLEFEDRIGEVSFDLMSVTVSVTERKLRAQWSPEMAQDVAAFHNIDAEAELTALLSEQVAAEIDREILRDLRKGAAWNLRWDYNGWKRLGGSAQPYTQKDWNQTLITAINQISAQIHKSTLRGGANWIVVSSEISAIFDDLEYFHVSNAAPEQDQYNMGIERVGTLAGRYQVYRDPYFPPNQVLMGHKGTSLLDTGYIYAPYVPLQLTPTMYNPFNFTPIKGIMTRYAKKMVNNRFYGRITVDGVRTFDLKELR